MSRYDRYDEWERGRRRRERDQGFMERLRDFFNDRDYGRDRDYDYDRDQDWERARRRRGGRANYGSLYGDEVPRRDWDPDEMYGQEYAEDYGRSYNRGRYDRDIEPYGRRYNRDWEFRRGYDREYDDPERARYNYYNRDWPEARRRAQRGRRYYGTAGMRSDFEGAPGRYPSAGMRSDYGYDPRRGYEDEDDMSFQRRPDRYEHGSQYSRGYDQDYIGYEPEGAFYQDLDEPVNYRYRESWQVRGEFSGVGPQNYRRSDESIIDDVCQRLTSHGRIDASQIELEVDDGEVVLRGTVPNRAMKRMAEDAAESVSGVRDVRNEIRVRRDDVEDREQHRQGWQQPVENQPEQIPSTGMAGESTYGAGVTSAGATSMEAMEAASGAESKRSQLREGMEVIGSEGKVVGRVKEIRRRDFLVDRDIARDVYIPFEAVSSVGAQILLNIGADAVDDQDWEKPDLIG